MAQEVWITVVGVGATFVALGLLMVLVAIMGRVFKPGPGPAPVAEVPPPGDGGPAQTAAIAVGLALAIRTKYRSERSIAPTRDPDTVGRLRLAETPPGGEPGRASRQATPSRWRAVGRRLQMASKASSWPKG